MSTVIVALYFCILESRGSGDELVTSGVIQVRRNSAFRTEVSTRYSSYEEHQEDVDE